MFKPFLGTKLWCLCDEGTHWENHEGECFETERKDYNGECFLTEAQHPVIMGQFDGHRICGKRGGDAFKDVTRPDSSGQCPEDMQPCSSKTSVENTVCYPENDLDFSCPITDIDIVGSNEATQKQGHSASAYEAEPFGEVFVIWSKDVDSLPITGIRIGGQPCSQPWKSGDMSSVIHMPNEVEQDGTCSFDEMTGQTTDSRY